MSGVPQAAPPGVAWVGGQETLRQAGHQMGALGLGVLLVCGDDGQIEGVLSRDMVVACIAAGLEVYRLLAGALSRRQLADALLCIDAALVLALGDRSRAISGPLPGAAQEIAGRGAGAGQPG